MYRPNAGQRQAIKLRDSRRDGIFLESEMKKKIEKPIARMSGSQLKKIRKKIGMTRTEMGEALWIKKSSRYRSILDWEKGKRKISSITQLAVLYLEKHGVLPRP